MRSRPLWKTAAAAPNHELGEVTSQHLPGPADSADSTQQSQPRLSSDAPSGRRAPLWKTAAAAASPAQPAADAELKPAYIVSAVTMPSRSAVRKGDASTPTSPASTAVTPASADSGSPLFTLRIGVLALQGAFIEHVACLQRLAPELLRDQNVQLEVSLVRTGGDLQGSTGPLHGLILPGGESTAMRTLLRAGEDGLLPALQEWLRFKRPTFGTCAGSILMADRVESDESAVVGPDGANSLGRADAASPSARTNPSDRDTCVKLGGLDVSVARNFFGRQLASFTSEDIALHGSELVAASDPAESATSTDAAVPAASSCGSGVFIRAPAFLRCGPSVQVLATLPHPESHRRAKLGAISEPSSTSNVHLPLSSSDASVPAGDNVAAVGVRSGCLLATTFHPELTSDLRWHRLFARIALENAREGHLFIK